MDPEITRSQIEIVPVILGFHKFLEETFSVEGLTNTDLKNKATVFLWVGQTINGSNGSHNDRVPTFDDGVNRAGPHHLNLIVHHRVFCDVCVCLWDIGLRLIEIEVRNEILDSVMREEFFELPIKLRGQCFVMDKDQSRSI